MCMSSLSPGVCVLTHTSALSLRLTLLLRDKGRNCWASQEESKSYPHVYSRGWSAEHFTFFVVCPLATVLQ